MSPGEPVCAACEKPLEGTNWRWIGGRGYHEGCRPKKGAFRNSDENIRSLGAYAERKARDVLRGRGQRTLDEDR